MAVFLAALDVAFIQHACTSTITKGASVQVHSAPASSKRGSVQAHSALLPSQRRPVCMYVYSTPAPAPALRGPV